MFTGVKKSIVKIYTDGSTKGHNKLGHTSRVGLGIFFEDTDERFYRETDGKSSNEAEFMALIYAMKLCEQRNIRKADFYLDSQIVVNRAHGKRPKAAKHKNERMDYFQDMVLELKETFSDVSFTWIPREQNTIADELSKQAVGNS